MKTDCKPNRLRKYHDREDTHRTSRSRVATPDWSMDLNRRVRGKGNFTDWDISLESHLRGCEEDLQTTNPEKNALIHPIIKVCGTIIAIFPFIIPIMPSIAAGSVMGFAAGLPLLSGSVRKAPSLNAETR